MTVSGLTREASAFAAGLQYAAIPARVVSLAKRCIIDGLGVEIAGSREPVMNVLARFIAEIGGRSQARAIRAPEAMPVSLCALWNGTAGHAMDWDDTQLPKAPDRLFGYLTHPTTTPLAAALALVDRGGVDGRTVLTAFLAGFEVECKLAEAIDPGHAVRGFQSTATLGTFGAAVTAAKLLGYDEDGIAQTIGMAASMAAGIKSNFGSMAKLVQVGRAAENGVVAAQLVGFGLTAKREALDGPDGYFAAAGPGGDPGLVLGAFGAPFSIEDPGVSIKPYPSGVLAHQPLDGMRAMLQEHPLAAGDIRAIEIGVGRNIADPIKFGFANTGLEAKFCLPLQFAALILDGRVGPRAFTDEYVQSPRVTELERRIRIVVDPEVDALGYERIRSKITVDAADGRRLVGWSDERYRGGPELPFSDAEVDEKFAVCAEGVLDEGAQRRVLDVLWSLDELDDCSRVIDLVNAENA